MTEEKPGAWKEKAREVRDLGYSIGTVARRVGKRWEHAQEAVDPEVARKRSEQRKNRARIRYAKAATDQGESVRRYTPKGKTEELALEHGVSKRTIRDWILKGKIKL